MRGFGEEYAIGKELKAVLDFLHGYFPDFCEFSEIVRAVQLNEEKVKRLIVYANDESLVYVEDATEKDITKRSYRLAGKGIDKLSDWGDEDTQLMI